ncbi:ABC transporter permease [Flavihumibacter profundi]|uniref:ABC transporter permease n=1 Tax=Flavihumibacter profundi TaxID=2716883 RepID=UPI001CC3BB45|nr:ABC transporter permease [Flavihumibacter profundi]MBZ5856840.1 ABC transporter permease [Flavihumibacter profundi]
MRQFLFFVKKEFYHLVRDRQTFFILLCLPLALILIFGFALTNEVKNSRIAVLDNSKDKATRAIIDQLEASRYFDILEYIPSNDKLEATFRSGKIKLAVVFPPNFNQELLHTNTATIQLIGDASDPNTSNALINYATAVIMDYQAGFRNAAEIPLRINTEIRMLYNPQLKGSYNFVPGVMAMVLMLVCAIMTSISIAREKEIGTMEVILVSPIVPMRLVFAKMVPYFLMSVVNIGSILLLSVYVLDVPIQGNLVLLILECMMFTIASLALGLLISSISNSQQVAMLLSVVVLFLPTAMLSGFMFPVENMPAVLRFISHAVPARWFYTTVINIMIKGLGFEYVWKETLILAVMTVFFLAVSILNFKTRLE